MKALIMLLTALVFSGCTVSPINKAKQDVACKNHGGVYEYESGIFLLQCNDGTLVQTNAWVNVVGPDVVEAVKKHKEE